MQEVHAGDLQVSLAGQSTSRVKGLPARLTYRYEDRSDMSDKYEVFSNLVSCNELLARKQRCVETLSRISGEVWRVGQCMQLYNIM